MHASASSVTADDWLFDDWLAANPQLTRQVDLPFVDAPAQSTEPFSASSRRRSISAARAGSSGGISNPSMRRVAEIAERGLNCPRALPAPA